MASTYSGGTSLIGSSPGNHPSLPGSVTLSEGPMAFCKHSSCGLSASGKRPVIYLILSEPENQTARENIEAKSLQGKRSVRKLQPWRPNAMEHALEKISEICLAFHRISTALPCEHFISGAEAHTLIRKARVPGYLGPNIPASVNKSALIWLLVWLRTATFYNLWRNAYEFSICLFLWFLSNQLLIIHMWLSVTKVKSEAILSQSLNSCLRHLPLLQ